VLVYRAPEIEELAVDLQVHLIHVPSITRLRATLAQLGCESRAEAEAPPADALVADHQASLGEKQLNVLRAQAEEVIKPDCMPDDLSREAIPRVSGGIGRHLAILAQPPLSGHRSFNVTMPR
jgi:hypothetical protein